MLSAIWSGAGQASDIFLLIGAILAGLAALLGFVPPSTNTASPANRYSWASILLAAAVCLIALGLLAV
jgi:hypothetical protein